MMEFQDDVKNALDTLIKGGLILYPTDTIWGIGCDATNPAAVKRVYELKQRIEAKAMIVLIDTEAKLNFYLKDVPSLAYDLIELSEKPVTIVYDGARNLADNLISEDGSIGIRVTTEKFSNELCKRFRKAIVSTSANMSGTLSPQFFADISNEIKSGVDYVVRYRQNENIVKQASSIVKLGVGGEIKIIRK